MANSRRKLFDSRKLHAQAPDLIKVLVSLKLTPDDSCLSSLEMTGLHVNGVAGNKLTGDIAPQHLARLEQHDAVGHVERSVRLKTTLST